MLRLTTVQIHNLFIFFGELAEHIRFYCCLCCITVVCLLLIDTLWVERWTMFDDLQHLIELWKSNGYVRWILSPKHKAHKHSGESIAAAAVHSIIIDKVNVMRDRKLRESQTDTRASWTKMEWTRIDDTKGRLTCEMDTTIRWKIAVDMNFIDAWRSEYI